MHNKGRYTVWTLTLLATVAILGFLQLGTPVATVSTVEAPQNIEVYWDNKCTDKVYSIDWGTLAPGQIKKTVIYVRNEGSAPILLNMSTTNYNPANASNYINFAWSCSDNMLEANQSIQIIQSLQISPKIKSIYSFSFNVILKADEYLLGDINKDGCVNFWDSMLFASCFGSNPQDTRWNSNADLDRDGVVSILDAIILSSRFQ
jgi:hypothetical protein